MPTLFFVPNIPYFFFSCKIENEVPVNRYLIASFLALLQLLEQRAEATIWNKTDYLPPRSVRPTPLHHDKHSHTGRAWTHLHADYLSCTVLNNIQPSSANVTSLCNILYTRTYTGTCSKTLYLSCSWLHRDPVSQLIS